MNTIIATFTTQASAKQAAEDLRDAGFESFSMDSAEIPEAAEAKLSSIAPNPGLVAAAGANNNTGNPTPAPALVVAPLVNESLEANTRVRFTLKTEKNASKAIAIINDHGGVIEDEFPQGIRSTIDEVANAAQAADRLK